jgi:hypothetical protein
MLHQRGGFISSLDLQAYPRSTLLHGTTNTSMRAETSTLMPQATPLTETATTRVFSKSATKSISHASAEDDSSRSLNSPQVSGLQSYTPMPGAGDTLSFGMTHQQCDAGEEWGEETSPKPENPEVAESDDPVMMYIEIGCRNGSAKWKASYNNVGQWFARVP